MWGLEYALLFGIPGNKIELIRGRSRWAFPFARRELAEAHFANWLDNLARWKQVSPTPAVRKAGDRWKARVGGIRMELFPRPIELRLPIAREAFDAFLETHCRPDLWPGEPAARSRGLRASLDHQDVQMNLWVLFGGFCDRYGGVHAGRVDIALSDTAAVAPDQYYFAKDRRDCMIEGDYFHGVPDLIAEVLSPASRAIDRGPRRELYRRSGVPHLWLLDPEFETLDVYELADHAYRLAGRYAPGEAFRSAPFPDETVHVDELFRTQANTKGWPPCDGEAEPVPEWLVAPDRELGLEYFFLFGHPDRRWEIWGNRSPAVLAFGSSAEAGARFDHFLRECRRWEGVAPVPAATLDADVQQAEVGRFQLTRRGRHVHLDVKVDARRYRDLLGVWAQRDAWDWGEG
jgi:hypothetical protein